MSLTTNPFSKEKGFTEKGCAVYGNKGDKKPRVEEMVEETDGLGNGGFGDIHTSPFALSSANISSFAFLPSSKASSSIPPFLSPIIILVTHI